MLEAIDKNIKPGYSLTAIAVGKIICTASWNTSLEVSNIALADKDDVSNRPASGIVVDTAIEDFIGSYRIKGEVEFDTSTGTVNGIVYLGTSGGVLFTKPTTGNIQPIGVIKKVGTTGLISFDFTNSINPFENYFHAKAYTAGENPNSAVTADFKGQACVVTYGGVTKVWQASAANNSSWKIVFQPVPAGKIIMGDVNDLPAPAGLTQNKTWVGNASNLPEEVDVTGAPQTPVVIYGLSYFGADLKYKTVDLSDGTISDWIAVGTQ